MHIKLIVLALVLLVAIAAVYYYAGGPDLRYLAADSQTRQRLDTEKLQRDYRIEAKALEQQLRTALTEDQDIAAKIEGYNSIVFNCRKKYIDMLEGMAKSINAFAVAHSKPSIPPDYFTSKVDVKSTFPDKLLMKELRADSVSDAPTSIRTDEQDLLKRYHADVNVTVSVVMFDGKATPTQNTFIANANPEKKWSFPSVTDVKQRVLTSLDEINRTVQSGTQLELSKLKLELESMVREKELEVETQQLQQKYSRP